MSRFEQGQAYRSDGPGVWIVEAIFEGPVTIYGGKAHYCVAGYMQLRNQDLNMRIVIRMHDPRLDKLKRIHGAAEELVA